MTTPEAEHLLAGLVLEVARLADEVRELRSQITAAQKGLAYPVEVWLPTKEAVEALSSQGIRKVQELRDLVSLGVLPVNGEHVRDVSDSPGRATYEFNVAACLQQVKWWKGLMPEERQRIKEQRYERPRTVSA